MGVAKEAFLLPAAPFRGIGWVLRQVVAVAEEEYYDPAVVQHELKELEQQLVQGRIAPEEFDRIEDELLDRLEAAQQWQAERRGER